MDFLKILFGEEPLSYEQFAQKVNEKGFKLADLSTGEYVGVKKHTASLEAKDATIADLNTQISTRDSDLKKLQEQLEKGGADNAQALEDAKSTLESLKTEYAEAKTGYENKLSKQAYEFAVKEFAGSKEFTSNAAKRDFINEMTNQELKFEKGKIMGAEDFVSKYSEENSDAFVVNEPDPEPEPEPTPSPNLPTFTDPTPPASGSTEGNAFVEAFSFQGVRPREK